MEEKIENLYDSSVMKIVFQLIDDMEKQILSFSEVDDGASIFKLQRNLLKDIALVKTIIETNSIEILDDISSDSA